VEQLKAYYNAWKTNLNITESLTLTSGVRKPLTSALIQYARSSAVPDVLEQPLRPCCVEQGLRQPNPDNQASTSASATQSGAVPMPQSTATEVQLARQHIQHMTAQSRPQQKQRKPRTCARCAIPACKGKKSRDFCDHPCRDCGLDKSQCRGRNSKYPNEPCHLARLRPEQ